MAPTIQRSEIEALVYHSKRGDAGALLDIARTIATREKHTVMTIIAVVRDHTNRNRGLGVTGVDSVRGTGAKRAKKPRT